MIAAEDLPAVVAELAKAGFTEAIRNIDPREQSFRDVCLRFGDQELYDKILSGCP